MDVQADGGAVVRFETTVAAVYKRVLQLALALLPGALAAYLHLFGNPAQIFMAHGFHEAAIALSIALALFVAWATWRCYDATGEPFLRYLALAFLGFAIVYAPHGAFTRHSTHDLWLFLLFGPASRLVMGGLVLAAVLFSRCPPEAERRAPARWLGWICLELAAVLAVAVLAETRLVSPLVVRQVGEWGTVACCVAALAALAVQGPSRPLAGLVAPALLCFIQSCLTFLVATPWSHLWWLAHAMFAAGFFVLSYGVMRALATNRSFTGLFGEVEMMARLSAAQDVAEAHRQGEERLTALLAASPEGVAVLDETAGTVLFANMRCRELLGDMEERSARAILDTVRRSVLCGGSGVGEMELAGGRYVATAGSPLTFGGQQAVVAWIRDITARKRAESELLRLLADKEVLLAELNHRVKNNLQMVSRMLSMQAARAGTEARTALDEARRRIDTLGALHRRLHSTEYTGELKLGPALEDLCAAILAGAGGGRDVRCAVDAAGVSLPVDKAVPLFLLVNELVFNACKHAFPQGSGTVRVTVEPGRQGTLTLAVADDGVGLAEEAGEDGGSLGLRLAHAMAGQLGGSLEIEPSRVDGGARFAVTFPVQSGAPCPCGAVETEPALRPAADPRPHVLVVDDEILAAECIAEHLEDLGYRASVAANGAQALDVFHADPAQLVLTDLRMRGMGGVELLRHLRTLSPDLPVVVMSGQDMSAAAELGVAACLDKPVSLEELDMVVRRHLAVAA